MDTRSSIGSAENTAETIVKSHLPVVVETVLVLKVKSEQSLHYVWNCYI